MGGVTHRTSGKQETCFFVSFNQDGVDGDDFNAPILMQIYSGETDRAGKQRDGAALALFGLEIQPQQIPSTSFHKFSFDKFSH